jgi:hypothetical protein
MTGCEIGLGKTFDLGLCIKTATLGWLPEWVWWLLPYWPWLIVVGGLGLVYRLAGWPGVGAFVFGLGFLVGRRSADTEPDLGLPAKDAAPAPTKPKKRKTILDQFRDLPD